MNEVEELLVQDVLRTQLGPSATWSRHERQNEAPINIVLDFAEKHLGRPCSVYWADGVPPEMFCLRGFSEPVVIYSTRYLELWADIRRLLTTEIYSGDLKARSTEMIALRLISELSLRYDDAEFTACTLLQSQQIAEGLFFAPNTIDSLELEPMGPAYMACWFYGLAHELGHFADTLPTSTDSSI